VLTAARLGANLEVLVPSPQQIVAALPRLIEAVEGPVMDTADACLLLLAERVRDRGFKVVLSGEGADEALGGYIWHKTAAVMARLGRLHPELPRGLRSLISRFVTPGTPEPSLSDFFGELRPSLLDVYEPLSRARFLLYSDAMAEQALRSQPFAELDVDPERMRGWDSLNRSLYIEYKLMLPGHLLLGKGDRVGMHSSVENRYPFLDEAFIAFASRLAPSYKLRGRREKWILRELARRILPPEIADPPKSMFKANPLCQLDPPSQPAWVRQLTSPESLRRTGYFSVERVRREEVLQRILPSCAPRRFVVDGSYTALVMTQLFHHLFLGGGLCELPVWSPPDPALADPSFTTEPSHAP
jgi:asparagine synthase (glutamine-hydrolysing)